MNMSVLVLEAKITYLSHFLQLIVDHLTEQVAKPTLAPLPSVDETSSWTTTKYGKDLHNGVGDWMGKSSAFERFSKIPVMES